MPIRAQQPGTPKAACRLRLDGNNNDCPQQVRLRPSGSARKADRVHRYSLFAGQLDGPIGLSGLNSRPRSWFKYCRGHYDVYKVHSHHCQAVSFRRGVFLSSLKCKCPVKASESVCVCGALLIILLAPIIQFKISVSSNSKEHELQRPLKGAKPNQILRAARQVTEVLQLKSASELSSGGGRNRDFWNFKRLIIDGFGCI